VPRGRKSRARRPYHHGDLRRALLDAGLALLAETQRWDFSLREVARRAGVSHNAPYFHFADKRGLLAAIATAGYETLKGRMLAASKDLSKADEALDAIGIAYLHFGTENPAHYRLMFGPTLQALDGGPPAEVVEAAAASRGVLKDVMRRGIEDGSFKITQNDPVALAGAVLAAWSLVHGLTLLYIDGLATLETSLGIERLAGMVSETFMHGLAK
jgi:AcrR family transcriptional regulator